MVSGTPFNEDNEKAAIALIAFKDEEGVAEDCFDLLQQPAVLKDPSLPTYLILISAGLKDPIRRQAFKVMAKSDKLPSPLREDMHSVLREWNMK